MSEYITITDKGIKQPTYDELVKFNDPILRETMPFFDFANDNPIAVANILINGITKYKGLGLSANQIGLKKRCFVAGVEGNYVVYFNPVIIYTEGTKETLYGEGCLSLPGIYLQIRRPVSCVCSYMDYQGNGHEIEFTGLTARIIQHETDHLNGVMITDHVSDLKLQSALKKAKRSGINYTLKDLKRL